MELTNVFLYGVAGGLFAELLGLFKLRRQSSSDFPHWLKSLFYWMVTLCMILAGGVLCIIYTKAGIELNPLVALNIGASAPLIIGSIVAHAPQVGRID